MINVCKFKETQLVSLWDDIYVVHHVDELTAYVGLIPITEYFKTGVERYDKIIWKPIEDKDLKPLQFQISLKTENSVRSEASCKIISSN